jgi:hypothetical protein
MGGRAKTKLASIRRRSSNHPNPTGKKGDRNLFCGQYCRCLDFAINKSWDYWTCSECRFRNDQQYMDDYPYTNNDTVLYHTLPPDIYMKVG